MTYIVGLTGGIGSGKSAAADEFGRLGADIIDADVIAHALTAPGGAAIDAIRAAFGDDVIAADGRLDRARMCEPASHDPSARRTLEAIRHPMIHAETERRTAASTVPYVVLVIPLLVEGGNSRGRFDRVAVVDCPVETQITRTMARSRLDRAEVERIVAAQASRDDRRAAADDIIDNDGDLPSLHAQVAALHAAYLAAATGARDARMFTSDGRLSDTHRNNFSPDAL